MTIKLAIADDHPMMIDGIRSLLSHYPDIILTGYYLNGAELMAGIEDNEPDVLLLDIQMPDKTGDELTPLILKKYPDIKILVLTNFDSSLYANNMFKRGVHGYLLKSTSKELLIQAIETVYKGEIFIEQSMKEKMQQLNYKVQKTVFSKASLTPREKEILQLIVDGKTSQEVADVLFIGLTTVINYRTSIMLKLDVNNTASLVKKALKWGLVE